MRTSFTKFEYCSVRKILLVVKTIAVSSQICGINPLPTVVIWSMRSKLQLYGSSNVCEITAISKTDFAGKNNDRGKAHAP